jgi:curved DNA-binding protein CbpA
VTDPWQELGLAEGASAAERREAYRRLVREHHPDRFPPGSAEQEAAESKMADINAAYRMLNDPNELERFRRLQRRRTSAQRSAQPGEDGTHFAAGDPRHGGAVEPAPGDPDFDYRERAWREFPTEPTEPSPPPPPWPAKKRRWRDLWRR